MEVSVSGRWWFLGFHFGNPLRAPNEMKNPRLRRLTVPGSRSTFNFLSFGQEIDHRPPKDENESGSRLPRLRRSLTSVCARG